MPRTPDHLILARRIAQALIAVINDTPSGAPADRLFAPLAQYLDRAAFDRMMTMFVDAGRITQRHGRYYPKEEADQHHKV